MYLRIAIYAILTTLLVITSLKAVGQDEPPEPEPDLDQLLTIDTPVTIDLGEDEEKERVAPKKKRRKPKVFYGIKTKKGFTRTGFGDGVVIELFYYLKEPVEVDPYVRRIYWYDFKTKSIKGTKKVDYRNGVILHGPYKKMQGDKLIEEGIFYMGMKHGRWMRYNKNDVLIDKKKYYKGWPKESLVNYYDLEKTKLKEIIPVHYGKKDGTYFRFYESGAIAVTGEYLNDEKVGEWTEFYLQRGRRKKIVQYRNNPFNHSFKPFIKMEWDEKGNIVYDREEEAKKLSGL